MKDSRLSSKLTPLDLAAIISDSLYVEGRHLARAYRIFHGALPTKEEMVLIYHESKGKIDGNFIYGLPKSFKDL